MALDQEFVGRASDVVDNALTHTMWVAVWFVVMGNSCQGSLAFVFFSSFLAFFFVFRLLRPSLPAFQDLGQH